MKKGIMLGYLKNKLRNRKIAKKFTIPVVSVMILLIAVILVVSNLVLYWSAIRKAEKEVRSNCDMIAVQLENVSNNAQTCLKTVTKDINRIYNGENVFGITDVESVQAAYDIYAALDYSRICFPDITALIYVDKSGRVVVSGDSKIISTPIYEEMEPLIRQIPEKGLANVKELGVETFPFLETDLPAWILGHRIIDMNTGKNIGYAFAVVMSDTLSKYFPESQEMGYYCDYQLWDEDQRVIASKDSTRLLQVGGSEKFLRKFSQSSNFHIHEQNEDYLVTSLDLWHDGWVLVNRVEIRELTKEIQLLCGIVIAAGGLCILLSIFLIRKIANWITRPIQELTDTVGQFRKENLDIRCTVQTADEVGELAGVFNEMLDRIKKQMENIRSVQKQKRKYELALFQAQIKPHFLYNTLDLIYIFCQMGNAKGGAEVTKALADYYRSSLSSGREIVTIGEEIKNISSYLFIQKERYSNVINFEVQADPIIYNCEIPKMTLQPLVENAIYHGLKSKRRKGTIRVWGRKEKEMVCLAVEDDGVGMDEETKNSVLCKEEEANSTHFGLYSVHRRLQLYYGEEYGLRIESEQGKGTRILLHIPEKGAMEC